VKVFNYILLSVIVLLGVVSCKNQTINGNDNAGKMESTIHYRPGDIKMGDLIPYYWDDDYHVFYLRDGNWAHIVSQDLVTWKVLPDALQRGADPLGPDSEGIWTGSLVEDKGTFYLFYTGKNINDPKGDQKVMRALSKDLITWEKDTTFIFYADGKIYWNKTINGAIDDRHPYHHQAFRDPHVIWNEDANEWWMAFHAMLSDGSYPVVSFYTSKNLTDWVPQQPLVTYPTSVSGDCPDIFRVGDKWNINLADYHYVQVDAPGAVNPEVLQYDCGDLRVAKTMFDGKRRVILGWIGDYAEKKDSGNYEWGGIMSMPREIYADSKGILYQRPVQETIDLFDNQVMTKDNIVLNEYMENVPLDYMLHATLYGNDDSKVSLLFRQAQKSNQEDAYRVSIDYKTGEIALGNRYREHKRVCEFDKSKPLDIRLFVDGTVAECFINDAYCFTMRIYDCKGTGFSFISEDTKLKIKDLSIYSK